MENVGQRPTLNEVHREVMVPIKLAGLVNANDIRVLQVCGGLRFAAEAEHLLFAGKLPRQDHLQRDDAVEADLSRAIDHAHPAAGYFFQQFVIAESADPARRLHIRLAGSATLAERRIQRALGAKGPGPVFLQRNTALRTTARFTYIHSL